MKKIEKFNEIDEENAIVIKNMCQTIPESHMFEYTVVYEMRNDEEIFEILGLVITFPSYITLKNLRNNIKITLYEYDLEWCEMFEVSKFEYPQYFI